MSPKLPVIKHRQLLSALSKAGFKNDRQQGSLLSLIHPDRPQLTVTVPIHNKDIKKGTLFHILKQADISVQELIYLLVPKF